MKRAFMFAVLVGAAAGAAFAQPVAGGWQAGAVLDLTATSKSLALGQRDKGFGLGHSDLSVFGPMGAHLEAQGTAALHSHDRKVEAEVEEAWVQTRTLPAGFQLRAGRFASQIGYLNEQHPHADDFVERPLLYRAFLGGHWNDDGVRLNWVAPTPIYLRLGAEVFRGKRLVGEAAAERSLGAAVFSAKAGGTSARARAGRRACRCCATGAKPPSMRKAVLPEWRVATITAMSTRMRMERRSAAAACGWARWPGSGRPTATTAAGRCVSPMSARWCVASTASPAPVTSTLPTT